MRDFDKELKQDFQNLLRMGTVDKNQSLSQATDQARHVSLLDAATCGDLDMVKHIVGKGVDLSHKHKCWDSGYEEKSKCVAAIVKTKLDEKIKRYHDDDYFKDDALDLWDGDGTRNRNQLYKEIDPLEEVYDYLRIETKKTHPELVL